jgi:hypothetical protein
MRQAAVLLLAPWLAVLAPSVAAAGEPWPPIPPEVWALKGDAAARTAGAVILEYRIAFQTNRIQYTYRARILGEQGRDAVELGAFPPSAYGFDGRTVHADGSIVRFSERKDFQSVTVKSRSGSGTVSRFVPPAVTGDCVVELRWFESAQEALGPLPPEYGFFHQWTLGNRYRTLMTVVEVPSGFPWAYQLAGVDAYKPEVKGGVYTIRNLPPVEPAAFSLDALRGLPELTVYWQPDPLRPYVGDAKSYWDAVGRLVHKELLGRVSRGSDYEVFAREIAAGLPEDPRRKALSLRERLDGRIANLDSLTIAEETQRSEKQVKEQIDPMDLGAAVRRRGTTGYGMLLLFLNLAKDAGLKPTVALVTDRERRIFRPSLLAAYQLDGYLVGIAEPGKPTLWLDPSTRFGGGVIPPGYQGTAGLQLDLDQWTLTPVSIPPQPAAFNVRRYTYELTLGEEQDQFTVKGEFAGSPEHAERWRYFRLEPAEQARRLKEDLERNLNSAEVTRPQVLNAQSHDENLSWTAEGRIEVEHPQRRTVSPFPSMYWPLNVPRKSETGAARTLPIVMPYLQVHAAQSTVRYPAGYRLLTGDSVQHANSLGSVSLSLRETAPRTVDVVLRVEIGKLSLPAESHPELEALLAWMADACGRTFVLEKER